MAEFEMKCPHCDTDVVVQEDWIGNEVECPSCGKTFEVTEDTPEAPNAPITLKSRMPSAANTPRRQRDPFFTFICPVCGTQAKLQSSVQGTEYECKACREVSIAQPTTEKKCPYCGETINFNAAICKFCKKRLDGIEKSAPSLRRAPTTYDDGARRHPKSLWVYIILGWMFGTFGFHDFYAGYISQGIMKIVLSLTVIGLPVSSIWALIDIWSIRADADGIPFE